MHARSASYADANPLERVRLEEQKDVVWDIGRAERCRLEAERCRFGELSSLALRAQSCRRATRACAYHIGALRALRVIN